MKKRSLLVVAIFVIALFTQFAFAAETNTSQAVQENYGVLTAELSQYCASWFVYVSPSGKRADSYRVSLRRLNDDVLLINNRPTTNNGYNLGYLTQYSTYRVWVGAIDSNGTLMAQKEKEFVAQYDESVFIYELDMKKLTPEPNYN